MAIINQDNGKIKILLISIISAYFEKPCQLGFAEIRV